MRKRLLKPIDMEDQRINDGIRDDPDTFELDERMIGEARVAADSHPQLIEAYRRSRGERGLQKAPTKERITIRLSPEVVERFRATGAGWQTRIDSALKDWLKTHRP